VMAVGKSGEPVEPALLSISFGGHPVAHNGARAADLDETPIAAHLKEQEVLVEISVGSGPGRAVVWTCDLTHDYISINADYRS
jgi:glutamate N-acetyltransferase/amino-acid N-acetyltransferase